MRLIKKTERDFVVLNLSDPQLSGQDWRDNGWKAKLLRGTGDRLMAQCQPDLITVTGDITRGSDDEGYRFFGDWLEAYGIPWTFVFGNHDNQDGQETVSRQADRLMAYSHCLFEKGDPALGCGNYSLTVAENGKPIYGLVFMDTHDMVPYRLPDGTFKRKWAYLTAEQLEWYRAEIDRLGHIPTALLMHIPFRTYETAFQAAWNPVVAPEKADPGDRSGCWKPGFEDCFGVAYEEVSAYPQDLGEADAIADVGSADLVLVGHNHTNNFVVPYRGMRLAFAMKAGAGSYWDPRLNGGTVLRVSRQRRALEHLYVDPASIVGDAFLSPSC